MKIELVINIDNDEKNRLLDVLSSNEQNLKNDLAKIAKSAFEEYKNMVLGKKIFTRSQDFKEYRLFLLIKEFFDNSIPDEKRISDLFQTTNSESKKLLQSVLAKYRYDLEESINSTLKNVIQRMKEIKDENKYYITEIPINLVEEINKILSKIDGELEDLSKKSRSAHTYITSASSYEKLCEHFGIELGNE